MRRIGRVLRDLAANRGLAGVSIAWLLYVIAEYAVWIAILVYAYTRGGATTVLVGINAAAIEIDDRGPEPGPVAAVLQGIAVLRRQSQARLLVGLLTGQYVVVGTAFVHGALFAIILLGAVGVGRSVLDVATRTLLQRTVPSSLLGRIFGVVEGLSVAGLAAGSLLVPLLTHLGGTRTAFIGTAAVIPLAKSRCCARSQGRRRSWPTARSCSTPWRGTCSAPS
jgi:hypothetical protein